MSPNGDLQRLEVWVFKMTDMISSAVRRLSAEPRQ